MAEQKPEISIVMAVHNGEEFLRGTLDSVLCQTMPNFECIVINDFSTDGTNEILDEYAAKDSRIKVYPNEENIKLAKSLNRGIELAQGKYIARLDADDICMRDRLEAQLDFMEANPEVAVSSCKFFRLEEGLLMPSLCGRKTDYETTAAMMLFFCPVLHPGVIARAEVLKQFSYNPEHTCSEDYDMWTRMVVSGYRVACQKEYLMAYRIHGGQITGTTKVKQHDEAKKILTGYYSNVAFDLSEKETDFLVNKLYFEEQVSIDEFACFYIKLCKACAKKGIVNAKCILPAVLEPLAMQKLRYPMSKLKQLKLLKFGGLRFIKEFMNRKKLTKEDFASAVKVANREGWEILSDGTEKYPEFRADL